MVDIAVNIAAVGKREGKRDAQLGAFLAAASKVVLAKSRELDRLRAENGRLAAAFLTHLQRENECGVSGQACSGACGCAQKLQNAVDGQ